MPSTPLRIVAALLLAVSVALAAAGAAWAHAELARAEPAPDSVLPSPPARVRLWFTGPVDPAASTILVTGPDGEPVSYGGARVAADDASSLETSLSATATGSYTVRWRIVSADGHPSSGEFRFGVGALSTEVGQAGAAESAGGSAFAPVARWLHLAGLAVAVGPAVLALLLARMVSPDLDRRLWRLSLGGALLLVAALALLLAQRAGLADGADGLGAPALRAALEGRWGSLWGARLALTALLLGLAALGLRRGGSPGAPLVGRLAVLGVGAALLVLTSLDGHPASTAPVWLSVLVDWVHLASTVAWLGGLLAIGLALLPSLRGLAPEDGRALLAHLVPRFSVLGVVCVELLVLTGLYATWAQVGVPSALTTTAYGQALLVKLGLVAALVAIAAVGLLVVRPRLAAKPGGAGERATSAGRLGRLVVAEALLGLVVLGLAARLTTLPPPRSDAALAPAEAPPGPPALTLAQNAGPVLVTLSLGSADAGSNRLAVSLHDQLGAPVTDARVRVRARPAEGAEEASVTTLALEGGRYGAAVGFPSAGRWRLEVLVARPDEPEAAAPFEVVLPVPGAKDLLAMADERMNRLRTLVEHNELTDGRGVVRSVIQYQAPDRMRYVAQTARGEVETYGIGGTRYERRGDAAWSVEPWPDPRGFRWPGFDYATSASDVQLLGREDYRGVECFVVSFLEERGNARIRAWIGTRDHLIHRLVMMAPEGHYMVGEYSGFDEPLDLEPPVAATPLPDGNY